MPMDDLQQKLVDKIIEERSVQEKRFVAGVTVYFLILLLIQFCVQHFFPVVYTGVVFRTFFLIVLAATLAIYFFLKKTYLVENKKFKNAIRNVFIDAGINEDDFIVKKEELIKSIESDFMNKDRNIEILYKNLKSL